MGKVALLALVSVMAVTFAPAALPRGGALIALLPLLGALRWRSWRGGAVVVLIAALAVLQVDQRRGARIPPALDGGTLELEARIDSLPDQDTRRTRFELVVDGGPLDGRRLAATWYDPPVPLRAAERWRLRLKVRRPRGHLNPGAGDIEAAWFEHGIDGLAIVREGHRMAVASPGVLAARAALADRIVLACADRSESCAIVAGLAVGRTSGISDAAWRALRRTGTVHLVAISGLHVTLLGALAAWLAATGARRSHWLVARVPARVVAALVGLSVATAYALLAGASLPTRRTVLMLAVVASAALLRRPAPAVSVLAVALLAVLATDPLAVLAPGFWLSFVGVAALVACIGRPMDAVRGILREQAVATLALAPLCLIWFGVVPLVAPLANLVAVPVFNLVLVPFTLFGCLLAPFTPSASCAVFQLVARLLDLGMPALGALGEVGPSLARGAGDALALSLAVIGTVWVLAPRGTPARSIGALLWLPVLCATPTLGPGEFDVRVLDVGHGLAVTVSTRAHTLIYDTGPGGLDTDAADWAIQPALAVAGREPDLIVVSHDDADHAGGAGTLQRAFPSSRWSIGTGVPVAGESCFAGATWVWDGVRFELLHPPRGAAPRGNDGSCVLRVASVAGALLLPGDLEAPGERALLASGAVLRADALIAPHHGSASSSTEAFVAAVAPRVVVHSTGWRNRWGFPRAVVVARYRAVGAVQRDTGSDGAVELRFRRGRTLEVQAMRDTARVWREP